MRIASPCDLERSGYASLRPRGIVKSEFDVRRWTFGVFCPAPCSVLPALYFRGALRNVIMAIRILVTGGPFDKEYNEHTGQLFFKDTHIGEMLRLGRSRVEVTIRTIMMVDSLEMTDTDRALIVQNCLRPQEDRIVITHGTDTMSETAAAIAHAVTGKTVVLTGAMIPYAFGSSDGLFTLGSALSFVQVLPAGVYIAMNGKCFKWDRVRKNRERGEFEEIT